MMWSRWKKKKGIEQDVASGTQVASSLREGKALQAILEGKRGIEEVNRTAQANHHQAGFRAEHFHKATLNADAARKGLKVRAELTRPGQAADLRLTDGGKVIGEVQVKNCKSVARTTGAISRNKYDGMQKVVPSDQVEKVRTLAKKRGVDGIGERNYVDTSEKAAARVKAGGAQSSELSYEQAQDPNLGTQMLRSQVATAMTAAAASGAVFGGAFSAVSNIQSVRQGKKTPPEAVKAVAVDTTKAAAAGAVSVAATTAATVVLEKMVKRGLGGAPGAIVSATMEISKDALAWHQGRLTGCEVGARSVEHAVGSGGAWGGAVAGAAICSPIPVIGPLVGGVIGGMVGSVAAKGSLRQGKKWLSREKDERV